MSHRSLALAPLVLAVAALLPKAAGAAGDVKQISDFGANPSGIGFYLYTPTNVVAKPPIVVNVHACHGKGTDVCGPSGAFAQQADRYGFLVICPSAVSSDGCWDVHSASVLTHDGGGDATGIISMVKWVLQNKNGDPNRVYVAGHSSGGMMTNVMLGSYPDVFKAGAAYAGVPFACYAQGAVDSMGWNSNCAQGKVSMTGKEWGDLVRSAYPGFSGTRPRMQVWHGTTDDVVFFQNFKEEIKQWTNVFGLNETPTSTENNAMQSTWIRTRYADDAGTVWLEAIQETGQPHNLVVDAAAAIHFFGLDQTPPDAGAKDAAIDARQGTGGTGGTGGSTGGSTGTGTSAGGSAGGGNRTTSGTSSAGSGGNRASSSTEAGGRSGSVGGSTGGQTSSAGSQTRSADTGVGGTAGGRSGGQTVSVGGSSGSVDASAGGRSLTGGTSASAGGVSTTAASAGSSTASSGSSRKSGGCSVAPGSHRPGVLSLFLLTALLGVIRSKHRGHRGEATNRRS